MVTASRKTLRVADDQLGGLALEFLVLRGGADHGVGEEDVVLADGGAAQDGDVVEQAAAAVDLHLRVR